MKKYVFGLLAFISLSCNEEKFIIQTIQIQNGFSIVWYEHGGMAFTPPAADIDLMKGEETMANLFSGDNSICKISFSPNTLLILTAGSGTVSKDIEKETGINVFADTSCRIPSLYCKIR